MNIYSNNFDYLIKNKFDIKNYISNTSLFLIEDGIKNDSNNKFVYFSSSNKSEDYLYLQNLNKIKPNVLIEYMSNNKDDIFLFKKYINLNLKLKKLPLFDNNSFSYINNSTKIDLVNKEIIFQNKINNFDLKGTPLENYDISIQENKIKLTSRHSKVLSFDQNYNLNKLFTSFKHTPNFLTQYKIYDPHLDISRYSINKNVTSKFTKDFVTQDHFIFFNKMNKDIFNKKILFLNKNALINPEYDSISKQIRPFYNLEINTKLKINNCFKIGRYLYIENTSDLKNIKIIKDQYNQYFKVKFIKKDNSKYLYQLLLVF